MEIILASLFCLYNSYFICIEFLCFCLESCSVHSGFISRMLVLVLRFWLCRFSMCFYSVSLVPIIHPSLSWVTWFSYYSSFYLSIFKLCDFFPSPQDFTVAVSPFPVFSPHVSVASFHTINFFRSTSHNAAANLFDICVLSKCLAWQLCSSALLNLVELIWPRNKFSKTVGAHIFFGKISAADVSFSWNTLKRINCKL